MNVLTWICTANLLLFVIPCWFTDEFFRGNIGIGSMTNMKTTETVRF